MVSKERHLKLRIELIPKKLFEKNLRSNEGLGKSRWDKLRGKVIETNGARCTICKREGHHGHEVWEYHEKKTVGTAVLLRVDIVCIDCHDIHHWGRTTKLLEAGIITADRYGFLIKHFCKVNRCSQQVLKDHALRSARIWLKRSKKKWRVDWGDFGPAVAQAQAARETWAARNPNHVSQDDPVDPRPGHHMRNRCPDCGAVGTLAPIEANRDEMSEGQEADYDQGMWGLAFCRACKSNVFWQA